MDDTTFRVRSPEGELDVRSLRELERLVQSGMVDLSDEFQLTAGGEWRKIAELHGLRQRRWSGFNHWYVLAAILVVEAVLARSFLIVVVTIGSHAIWYHTTRRGKRKPMRWW